MKFSVDDEEVAIFADCVVVRGAEPRTEAILVCSESGSDLSISRTAAAGS